MVLLIDALPSKLVTYNVTFSNWFRHNQVGFHINTTVSNTTDNNAHLLVSMLHAKLTKASCSDVNTMPNVQEPTCIDKYTGKLDHLPLVVVEAELGQVWPFCCWYSPTE